MIFRNRIKEYNLKSLRKTYYEKLLNNNSNKLENISVINQLDTDVDVLSNNKNINIRIMNLTNYARFLNKKIANLNRQL